MNTPLVSITSAIYNEGNYLLDMVRSVFAQTFTDWELLLLDDGSTDNSLELANSIGDPRVRVFANERNLGRSASRNRLNSLARGKYIAVFDADDMWSTTKIARQVEFIESQPDIDIVGTGTCFLNNKDEPMGHMYAEPLHKQICSQPNRTFAIHHATLLGKKTWFEKNLYDESISLAIDFNLFFRTYKHSRFANVPQPLCYYRLDQSFNLKKQFTARYVSAAFLFKHHKNAGKWGKALTNWTIQYGKFAVTVFMFSLGLRKKLMARRFNNLSDADIISYKQEIQKIKDTILPIRAQYNKENNYQ